jgi:AI-2 transport protein TqsA
MSTSSPGYWKRLSSAVLNRDVGVAKEGGVAAGEEEGESQIVPRRQSSGHASPEFEHLELTAKEQHFDNQIRTACLVILASAVIYSAMHYLQAVLVPFVMALALKYLLTPLIDCISCAGQRDRCLSCPRGIAVVLSFFIAICGLVGLGMVLTRSVTTFTSHADVYRARVETIIEAAFTWAEEMQMQLGQHSPEWVATRSGGAKLEKVKEAALSFMKEVSLTNLILSLLGTAAHVAEDVMYVLLFLVFMLTHTAPEDEEPDAFTQTVDRQVFVYIRGKGSICAFVAITNATVLWLIGVDLWLAFGVLSFFLNFIPNIGMFTAIMLPMPVVALDPAFSPLQVGLALIVPLVFGTFAKDVLEPLVLGSATTLQPVAVLMAIMLFGSVWGVTGMVRLTSPAASNSLSILRSSSPLYSAPRTPKLPTLNLPQVMAVPMTAVMRIYLSAIDHPLPRFLARVLAGHSHATSVPRPRAGGDWSHTLLEARRRQEAATKNTELV